MKRSFYFWFGYLLYFSSLLRAQSYTSYRTGCPQDTVLSGKGGVCLMGGASENDQASKWFLQQSNGGDILVLKTSGADGYNTYFYNDLGINVHSVETIVFHDSLASYEPYIHQRIQEAEGIWFAGGNQWNYVSYWRNTPVDSLIRQSIKNKNTVVGGTSAGMAILGSYYFTAQNGTVTSPEALSNPFHFKITLDTTHFVSHPLLDNILTDTHFDNPDRKGRFITFLARLHEDYGIWAKGIACDEYTAVCIDSQFIAKVFGSYPQYEDFAYFVLPNCEIQNPVPENLISNQPLTWYHQGQALKALKIPGDTLGTYTFDLKNWNTNLLGIWFNWSVNNGNFQEIQSQLPNCQSTIKNIPNSAQTPFVYYDAQLQKFYIQINRINQSNLLIYNILGETIKTKYDYEKDFLVISTETLPSGIYVIIYENQDYKFIKE